ncbi:MAG: hypothetical protein D6725_17075 [Planctomycetota bacterium]|nr:MAG: hypothetical protein D6725_17075 [Planctomycetota bacterium]
MRHSDLPRRGAGSATAHGRLESLAMTVEKKQQGEIGAAPVDTAGGLDVYLLGLVDFDSAVILQRKFVDEVAGAENRDGVLMLCEHPPVVTIGRDGRYGDVLDVTRHLRSRSIAVRRIPRGGPTLLHLPGQLAIYLVVPLDRLRLGVWEFAAVLQRALAAAAEEQQVAARIHREPAGVVTRAGQVGWMGAAVRAGITRFGAFLNVDPDLFLMRELMPEADPRITSLAAARVHPVSMSAVRESFVRHLSTALHYRGVRVYTGHPALQRIRRASLGRPHA